MGDFVKVAKNDDLEKNKGFCVEVEGKMISLYRQDDCIYAIDDICPHAHAHLSEGVVNGDEVVCPLHFATFNIKTGECTGPPASDDVATYVVRVVGEDVEIQI
ncbi:MAG: non-heme iron oxygenase ferredoxin subunit [Planctomycetota bacterium]|nr:non-heme iron oxygenase ferredoxin subunit [Planctomycetota bacterium]